MANTGPEQVLGDVDTNTVQLAAALIAKDATWSSKQSCLEQLVVISQQHLPQVLEAVLCAGLSQVLDSMLAIMVSSRTSLESKLRAADLLSMVCADPECCLLLSPSTLVDRLMRCATKGKTHTKAAAARALWQLACQQELVPEVYCRQTTGCLHVVTWHVAHPATYNSLMYITTD